MSLIIEDRLIRELPEKSKIDLNDRIVIEDMDGTKIGLVHSLRTLMMNNLVFSNVEMMKSSIVKAGDYCITLGYRTPGDGGAAIYRIVYEPTAIEDYANCHYLRTSDTDRALFVPINNMVTPEQFGAYGDGAKDDTEAIKKCLASSYSVQFNSGKTYRITKAIEVPNNETIDLNGCIIYPSLCSAFTVPLTATPAEYEDIVIKNGKIDMAGSPALASIVINKKMESLSVKNITIVNGTGACITANNTKKLVVENCNFRATTANSSSIEVGCNAGIRESIFISNTRFFNFYRALSLPSSNATFMNVTIKDCSLEIESGVVDPESIVTTPGESSLPAGSTAFVYNTRSDAGVLRRNISIESVMTHNVNFIFSNQANDSVTIKDIHMVNARSLFFSSYTTSTTVIEGNIALLCDPVKTLVDKLPVFETGNGNIYLNTMAVVFDANTYCERRASNNGYNYKLHDSMDIRTRPPYPTNYSATINTTIPLFRNGLVQLLSTGPVYGIAPGMDNQVLGLWSLTNASIATCASVVLKSETSKSIGADPVYFKFYASDGKWHEI